MKVLFSSTPEKQSNHILCRIGFFRHEPVVIQLSTSRPPRPLRKSNCSQNNWSSIVKSTVNKFFCEETTDQSQNRCFNLFARLVRDGRFVSPNRFLLERLSISDWEGNSISLAQQLSLVTPLPISGRERNSKLIAPSLSLVKLLPITSRNL